MPHAAATTARLEKPLISFHSQWAGRGLALVFTLRLLFLLAAFFSHSYLVLFIIHFSFTADSKPAVFLLIFTCRRRLTQFSALHIIILSAVDAKWAWRGAGGACH